MGLFSKESHRNKIQYSFPPFGTSSLGLTSTGFSFSSGTPSVSTLDLKSAICISPGSVTHSTCVSVISQCLCGCSLLFVRRFGLFRFLCLSIALEHFPASAPSQTPQLSQLFRPLLRCLKDSPYRKIVVEEF